MLLSNPKGGYWFLKGIGPYSAGVVAAKGFEIAHVRFLRPVALAAGFEAVAQHLSAAGRPKQALCGMELRSPRPFSFQGFNDFNAGYIAVLKKWDVLVDAVNPVARTNIAPEIGAPSEPSLYAFSYTVSTADTARTFVVAGAGELPEGSLDPHDVVRRGETTPQAIAGKANFVLGLMQGRVSDLGVMWADVTSVNVYTVHDLRPLLTTVLTRLGPGSIHGVTWHFSRPPIVSVEFEMDLRGVRRDMVIT